MLAESILAMIKGAMSNTSLGLGGNGQHSSNAGLRQLFRTNRPGNASRVVIASVPRCGSTLLLRSLAGLPAGSSFPKSPECEFVRDLGQLPKKPFLKTHSPAPADLPQDVRSIFLFGDPVQAVVSTKRKRFDRNHFVNCGYTAESEPAIYERDDLGYEAIFDSWMTPHEYPVLAVRYEAMFDHQEAMSEFLGVRVNLPPRRARRSEVPPDLRNQLSRVYGSLVDKVQEAPDIQLLQNDPKVETA